MHQIHRNSPPDFAPGSGATYEIKNSDGSTQTLTQVPTHTTLLDIVFYCDKESIPSLINLMLLSKTIALVHKTPTTPSILCHVVTYLEESIHAS
jgi:hypothetical protein